jgi:hypothetical protein
MQVGGVGLDRTGGSFARARPGLASKPVPHRGSEVSRTHAENEFPQASPAAPLVPADRVDRILQTLAERALLETGATSVAIGLLGDGAVTCRATAGLPVTVVGDPINHQTGLTGLAIRRQMSQWCTDTESDARVDQEICLQLGVRSMIVSPVLLQDSVVGVFAIFSPNPDALSLADLNAVKKLSHWVSEAVRYIVRKPSPLTVPPAIVDSEVSNRQPLPSFLSERAQGAGLGNHLAKIWRAMARALSGGHNGRTGQG